MTEHQDIAPACSCNSIEFEIFKILCFTWHTKFLVQLLNLTHSYKYLLDVYLPKSKTIKE